jgi:hypothetical protein
MDSRSIPADVVEIASVWPADTSLAPNWIDVSGSSTFVITDIDHPRGENLNRLLAVSPTNPYAASGQYLASLENLYSLPEVDWQIPAVLPAIDVWHYLLGKNFKAVTPPLPILSFDEILAIIADASKKRSHLTADYVVVAASLAHVATYICNLAKRGLLRRLRSTRRRLHRSIARFCALSWSRRLWYLLHGSHPPKTECRLAFGCA